MGLRNHTSLLDSLISGSWPYMKAPHMSPYLLLVESNEDDAFLTLRELHVHGFDVPVVVLGGAVEAIDFLDSAQQLPLAMLVAYRLPGMSGTELIDRIRASDRLRDVPILLVTSSEDEREHLCGAGQWCSGVDACLVKPIRVDSLNGALRNLDLREQLAG